MLETLETDSSATSPATTQEQARQRIDEYRRQALNESDPLVGALGCLSANLMDTLMTFQPGMDGLLAAGTAGRRQVAEQQHTLSIVSKFHSHVIGYVRAIAQIKKQNVGG
jgi:hypothetical protein